LQSHIACRQNFQLQLLVFNAQTYLLRGRKLKHRNIKMLCSCCSLRFQLLQIYVDLIDESPKLFRDHFKAGPLQENTNKTIKEISHIIRHKYPNNFCIVLKKNSDNLLVNGE